MSGYVLAGPRRVLLILQFFMGMAAGLLVFEFSGASARLNDPAIFIAILSIVIPVEVLKYVLDSTSVQRLARRIRPSVAHLSDDLAFIVHRLESIETTIQREFGRERQIALTDLRVQSLLVGDTDMSAMLDVFRSVDATLRERISEIQVLRTEMGTQFTAEREAVQALDDRMTTVLNQVRDWLKQMHEMTDRVHRLVEGFARDSQEQTGTLVAVVHRMEEQLAAVSRSEAELMATLSSVEQRLATPASGVQGSSVTLFELSSRESELIRRREAKLLRVQGRLRQDPWES